LRAFNILQPLTVEQAVFEDEAFAPAACGAVAHPSVALVALRAVGRHVPVIATDTPVSIAVHLVDDAVVGLKRADSRHFIIENFHFEVFCRRHFRQPVQLNVAEAMEYESGFPGIFTISSGGEQVGSLCRTKVCHIECTVGIKQFGKAHGHHAVFPGCEGSVQSSDHILSHIHQVFARRHPGDTNRTDALHHPDRRARLRTQLSGRGRNDICRLPAGVVITGTVPAGEFLAGIILFAVIFVVGNNRTFGSHFPAAVGNDSLTAAILILHFQPGKQAGKTEAGDRLTLGTKPEVTTVAENDTQGIVAFMQQAGDIVSVVID